MISMAWLFTGMQGGLCCPSERRAAACSGWIHDVLDFGKQVNVSGHAFSVKQKDCAASHSDPEKKFVDDFGVTWSKVTNLDRFDLN
jgi:hypothetical protein